MKKISTFISIFLLVFSFLLGVSGGMAAEEAAVDLALFEEGVSFSSETFSVGKTIRVYARVENLGIKDARGQVIFTLNNTPLGNEQLITVLAGEKDDVFLDFVIPSEDFSLGIKTQVLSGIETNLENNEILLSGLSVEKDQDRDGVLDIEDNCVAVPNPRQNDENNDGIGDLCEEKENLERLEIVEEEEGSKLKDLYSILDQVGEGQDFLEENSIVRIEQDKFRWNAFRFYAVTEGVNESNLDYFWDFGDGERSEEKSVEHTYLTSGEYLVHLTVRDQAENFIEIQLPVSIHFFNLGNLKLWAVVFILLFIAIGLLWFSASADDDVEIKVSSKKKKTKIQSKKKKKVKTGALVSDQKLKEKKSVKRKK